jgi:hypothetical protein
MIRIFSGYLPRIVCLRPAQATNRRVVGRPIVRRAGT